MFIHQINVQRHVIGALLIREIYSRFGREGLGFLWLIIEPLMFAIPVLLLWRSVRSGYENGTPIMPILISGYVAILLFRHLGSTMILFIRANASLLYHRRVTIFDIFLARCLLEIVSNISALVITFTLFIAMGTMNLPVNFPLFYLGYFYMIWWCMAIALVMGALTERFKFVERVWPVYSYTYTFFSGFFYLADWLPPRVRTFALLQPSLQAYEMIRGGLLGPAVKTYGDPAYTTMVLSLLTLFGLWVLREGRKYIMLE